MTQLDDALLEGKVVLITGGTQGVGGAIGEAAVRNGARIAVMGRRTDVGERYADQVAAAGGEAMFIRADVVDVDQCRAAVDACVAHFGRVDCLVNAAGLTTRSTLLDTTPEHFDQQIAVNIRAPFFLTQAVVKHLVDRAAPGAVLNIATMSAHGGQPHLAPYVTSKSALFGFTRNAAYAHRFDRIRINTLNIGWTDTPGEDVIQRKFHGAEDGWLEKASAELPMGKLGQVEEIADFAVFLLSERSGVATGSLIDWDQTIIGAHD